MNVSRYKRKGVPRRLEEAVVAPIIGLFIACLMVAVTAFM